MDPRTFLLMSGGGSGGGALRPKRRGRVTAAGKVFRDDTGPFNPLGNSHFWAWWGWKFDRDRTKKNAEYVAPCVDFERTFGEMVGGSWEDREINPAWPDYEDIGKGVTDYLFGTLGVRQQLTIFGGGNVDRRKTVDKVKRIIRGREEAFLSIEISNEMKLEPAESRPLAQELQAEFPGLLVGTTAPWAATQEHGWTDASFDLDVCSIGFDHSERQEGDEDWRQVRQGCETMHISKTKKNSEGPGFESSGAVLHDPLRLASLRSVGIVSGMAGYVMHTGAGIRGGGKADQDRGRAANFWEYDGSSANRPNLIETFRALAAGAAHIPADAPNWHGVKGHWPEHPLPADAVWSDDSANIDHGVVRTYGSRTENGFAVVAFGVRRYALLTPRGSWNLKGYDMLTGALAFERSAQDGVAFRVEGDPSVWGDAPNQAGSSKAYLIIGTR